MSFPARSSRLEIGEFRRVFHSSDAQRFDLPTGDEEVLPEGLSQGSSTLIPEPEKLRQAFIDKLIRDFQLEEKEKALLHEYVGVSMSQYMRQVSH